MTEARGVYAGRLAAWGAERAALERRYNLISAGRAILFVALAISAGFAVYLVSDFYAFRILGVFMPLTMLTSSLTALTLLPALVLLLRPRFIMRPPTAAR